MSTESMRSPEGGRPPLLRTLQDVLDQIERCAEVVGDNQAAQTLLDSAGDKLHAAVRELRRQVSPFGEAAPDGRDLYDELEQLARHAQQELGAPLELLLDESVRGLLGPVQSGHVLQILREALANAIRHAGANRMALRAVVENGRLVVRLSDDGCGFDPKVARSAPVKGGLAAMQQRADAARAFLQVASAPSAGTVVTLTVPLRSARSRSQRP